MLWLVSSQVVTNSSFQLCIVTNINFLALNLRIHACYLLFAGLIYKMIKCTLFGVARGDILLYIPIINNLGGVIESNLSWIPPDSDQRLHNIQSTI